MLTDNHIHSSCSGDGHNTMAEMALASYKKGVRYLCFTDHCDLDHFRTGVPDSECFSFKDCMLQMFEEAKKAVPADMQLFLGIELGEGNHDPERMAQIAASPELDFVLGSLHNLRNVQDFYEMKYTDENFCREMINRYMDELLELARLPSFDVMAHIGYLIRYIRRDGFLDMELTVKTHGAELEALLRTLIEHGKGIEINCSGLRNKYLKETMPGVDILRLYKQLGGEIITVGSDAHWKDNAGFGLKEGFDILRELGYKYVTIFRKRKPEFIKI